MNARHVAEAHRVVSFAPISQEAKHLGHLLVRKLGALNYPYVSASCETLAEWLEEEYAIRGCRYRIGTRGPARGGPRRKTLSRESIRRYVHELATAGLVSITGGGTAKGRRYAGRKPRGLRWWLRASGRLWDALRGAYKAWRGDPELSATPEPDQPALPFDGPLGSSLSRLVGSSPNLGSTLSPSGREQKVSAARTESTVDQVKHDAPAAPRTNEPASRVQRGDESTLDDFRAFVERRRAVDPPADDPGGG